MTTNKLYKIKKVTRGKSLRHLHDIKTSPLVILIRRLADQNLNFFKLIALPVFILGANFVIAQSAGNRVETSQLISPRIPQDSAIVEGEVRENTPKAPIPMRKIKIKETGKEVYADASGHFKTTVHQGSYKVILMGVDKGSKKEKDWEIMEVKVKVLAQHDVKLVFYEDSSTAK
jgi:hypothetical protein